MHIEWKGRIVMIMINFFSLNLIIHKLARNFHSNRARFHHPVSTHKGGKIRVKDVASPGYPSYEKNTHSEECVKTPDKSFRWRGSGLNWQARPRAYETLIGGRFIGSQNS